MRDITSFTGEGWLKDDDVVSLLKSDSYQSFWENLQGGAPPNNFENNFMGVHTGMSDSHKLERLLADYDEQLVTSSLVAILQEISQPLLLIHTSSFTTRRLTGFIGLGKT
jgi:hypothetical protein